MIFIKIKYFSETVLWYTYTINLWFWQNDCNTCYDWWKCYLSETFRLKLNLAILANLFKRLSDLNKSHLQLLTSKELYLAKAAYKFVVKNILLHRIKTKAANLI